MVPRYDPNKDEVMMNQELVFSRDALRSIDDASVNEFNIPSIVLMENAVSGAADIILAHETQDSLCKVTVLCGNGNNGGDGYALARHLHNANCSVVIYKLGEPKTTDAIVHASICTAIGIPIQSWAAGKALETTLWIDALLGTGADRQITGQFKNAIGECNTHPSPCIALDIPSGLDCDLGVSLGCCIEADLTITFVGEKLGFLQEDSHKYTGEVHVVGIGCPQSLVEKYGIKAT